MKWYKMPARPFSIIKIILIFLPAVLSCVPDRALGHGITDTATNNRAAYATARELAPTPAEKALIAKYADLLKTGEDHVAKFIKLYSNIDYWLGTPYLWGGCKKSGIDCSCFVMTIFDDVFNIKIKRTSLAQFCDKDVALFTNRQAYQLGDLIFFKTNISRETRNNRVTHVGLYLVNGYFVQSSSAGVNIANLNRGYWKSRIVAAGRLKASYYINAGIAMPTGETQDRPDIEVEENSTFEPIPFPEDMDYVTSLYSDLLDINKDDIRFPEVFDFIEKNRYAPHNVLSRCPGKQQDNNCLVTALYKDVFNINLGAPNAADFLVKHTDYIGDNKRIARFLDIVLIKPGKKAPKGMVQGIYLYNSYFLHLYHGNISISSLDDPAFEHYTFNLHRFKVGIQQETLSNIIEMRKSARAEVEKEKAQALLPGAGPMNILKKEGGGNDSLGTADANTTPVEGAGPAPAEKKKKKKKH